MPDNSFHLISLGCAKNSVDSESMTRLLVKGGYRANPSPQDADVVIVNTCGFIGPARDESFDVLRELAESLSQLVVSHSVTEKQWFEKYMALMVC